MDRTLLETVHFLGLDLELAIVAVLAALQGLPDLAAHLRARGKAVRRTARTSPPAVAASWQSNH
jgi:hypothetical protein